MLLLLSNTEAPSYEPGMVAGVVDLRPEIIILSLTLLFMLLSSTGALYTADECFLTGTGAEIIPVIDIDSRCIGNGEPGIQTMDLIAAFKQCTLTEGEKI